ncbi:MAG: RHS repeat protein [Blastocatellia bacterium]|nr:RHS repeat protein [Blastocatellia bacterium]
MISYIKSQLVIAISIILAITAGSIVGVAQGGVSSPQNKETAHKPDQNFKSLARINPSTLAMELEVGLMSYPGRNGNSFPVNINYSSKVWRMDESITYPYRLPYSCTQVFQTQVRPVFAERSNAGWTSSLAAPVIEEKFQSYTDQGKPYNDMFLDVAGFNSFAENSILDAVSGGSSNYASACGTVCNGWTNACWDGVCEPYVCTGGWTIVYCETGGPGAPESGPCTPPQPPQGPTLYNVKRVHVRMGNGSTHEFRKSDATHLGTTEDNIGNFIAVDGSGMKLDRSTSGSTLYLPDGNQFSFTATPTEGPDQITIYEATAYTDVNGNRSTFSSQVQNGTPVDFRTDTLGREFVDPLSKNYLTQEQREGKRHVALPSLDGAPPKTFELDWLHLKPVGCSSQNNTNCGSPNGALDPELSNQNSFYYTRQFCFGSTYGNLLANPNDINDPANEVLFPQNGFGVRACNPFLGVGPSSAVGVRFNPVVLASIKLPNDQIYTFKYNHFGEITKITYPSGSYEKFTYGSIVPMGGFDGMAYDQTNRGVIERRVYNATGELQQRWSYAAESASPNTQYKVVSIAPKANDPLASGAKTERMLYSSDSDTVKYGFVNPLDGKPYEERTFDEAGNMRFRTLNKWTVAPPRAGGWPSAVRDPRIEKSVSIFIEGSNALATLSEKMFDSNGHTDPEYFSHLNVKSSKTHVYKSIPPALAESGTIDQILSYFNPSTVSSASETDCSYDSNYKARGIIGLPVESRVLNPANPDSTNLANVLAKSEMVYDEAAYRDFNYTTTNWVDPGSTLRGNVTTTRTWVKESNTWLESHTMYDNFGNVRKVWDASGDASKFVETQYSSTYKYAYPTSVTTPAPDSTNTTGTNQGSTVSTTYDFNTGLPLTVTNDFGQITATEYDDPLLRPTRSYAVNFTAPETQTIYGDTPGNLFVKVRKQIDVVNWDEATTFADSLGRTIKTLATDSQGDIFVETHYDLLGRVERVTNPYRIGDTKYWSKTRYDVAGRAVETFAPATDAEIATAATNNNSNLTSLGITSFGISNVTDYVGTVVSTKDASGRRGRSITNALGQLIRVDEPTGISVSEDSDLGALATPVQATSYKYDVFGKMVEVTQGVQKRWFKYDALGRLLRVRQPEQEVNTGLNMSDAYNTSGQWTAGFTYDLLGNVLTATDANGTVITNTYDRAGRVTSRTYSNEPSGVTTPSVEFRYDGKGLAAPQNPNFAKGKLTKVSSTVSATEYQLFDNFGRVTQSAQVTDGNNYTSRYTYNFAGALVEEEYPSGRKVTNEFEPDGDLAKVTSKKNSTSVNAPFVSNFSYTASGGISQMKLGNGRWETAKFNNRMQVTELGLGASASDAGTWKTQYEYGELNADGTVDTNKNTGNIAKQTLSFNGLAHPLVQSYKYDALYRITEATETANSVANWFQVWGYDRYGNRTSFTQNIGGNPASVNPAIIEATNRFDETGTNFDYDLNGNLIRDGEGRQFTFNGDNKQTVVKDANNNTIGRYFYDGEGKRVKKITNSETTIFVYSNGKLVAEYSTQTSTSPSISYLMADHLDSPRVLTDANGQVSSRRDFLPFGEDLLAGVGSRTSANRYSSTTDSVRLKFTGYQKDTETSLDFAEERIYVGSFGRFTAVDPLMSSGRSDVPQTWNRYTYCLNNPIVCTDPTGTDGGIWARRSVDNGTEVRYFKSEDELNAENGIGFTDLCRVYTCSFWSRYSNEYILWEDQTASHLGANGIRTDFSVATIGQAAWDDLTRSLHSSSGFSSDQKLMLDILRVRQGERDRMDIWLGLKDDPRHLEMGKNPVKLAKQVGETARKFMSGQHSQLTKKAAGTGLDAHHAPQSALMKRFVPDYEPSFAISILVPREGHRINIPGVGRLSTNTEGFSSVRQVMARDIWELRRVYPGITNTELRQLIHLNRTLYPNYFLKPPK